MNASSAFVVPIALSPEERAAIEAEVDRLIAILDAVDGDCDLEDDDPAGDPLDKGEDEEWRPEGFVLPKPRYGEDQSEGPANEQEVSRAWRRHVMGLA